MHVVSIFSVDFKSIKNHNFFSKNARKPMDYTYN